MTKNIRIAAVSILLALGTSGCSSQVELVNPNIPKLLIEKIPLTVVVKYPDNFNHYVYEEDVIGDSNWTIDLGGANKTMFNNLFGSMFTSVKVIEEGESLDDLQFDAYIEPSIEKFEFAIPAQSRTKSYAVWIRYRLKVFDANGVQISNWPVSAYGKQMGGKMNGADTIKKAAVLAMRDATAVIGIQMDKATGVSKLSSAHGPAETTPASTVGESAKTVSTDEESAISE